LFCLDFKGVIAPVAIKNSCDVMPGHIDGVISHQLSNLTPHKKADIKGQLFKIPF
jgi:hypothetical protein